jgi:hypothetical protein
VRLSYSQGSANAFPRLERLRLVNQLPGIKPVAALSKWGGLFLSHSTFGKSGHRRASKIGASSECERF